MTEYAFLLVLSSKMLVGGDSLNDDDEANTALFAARTILLIYSSHFDLTSITLWASIFTIWIVGSRSSSAFNGASATFTRNRGDGTISSSVWRRQILQRIDSNFADTVLSVMACIIAAILLLPYSLPSPRRAHHCSQSIFDGIRNGVPYIRALDDYRLFPLSHGSVRGWVLFRHDVIRHLVQCVFFRNLVLSVLPFVDWWSRAIDRQIACIRRAVSIMPSVVVTWEKRLWRDSDILIPYKCERRRRKEN